MEEVDLTGPANSEAKDESDGESEKIEARRHPSKVFSSKYFHELDRVKCKGGYNVILKCINCGTEGQNNTSVKNHVPKCARLVKIEEAVDEFNQLYPKLAITSSGRKKDLLDDFLVPASKSTRTCNFDFEQKLAKLVVRQSQPFSFVEEDTTIELIKYAYKMGLKDVELKIPSRLSFVRK